MTRTIRFMETVLRDGQQSQIATRMPIEDMLPILETLDACGFEALEVWLTFDSCLRYLNEDPWERLRTIRAHVKNTKLQMLLRGQNLLGYRNYADDVVEALVEEVRGNGIDVIRIFDALNDTLELDTFICAAKEAGGEVQAAILLHHQRRAHGALLHEPRQRDGARRRRLDLHQGHGRRAHPRRRLQLVPKNEGILPTCPCKCTRTVPPASPR